MLNVSERADFLQQELPTSLQAHKNAFRNTALAYQDGSDQPAAVATMHFRSMW